MTSPAKSNFAHLTALEPALAKQGELAEAFLLLDANTSIVKLRQFAELLASLLAKRSGTWLPGETQHDRLDRLRRENLLTDEVFRVFRTLRQEGNKATHELSGDEAGARFLLRLAWQLGWWFHHTVAPQDIIEGFNPQYVEPEQFRDPAQLRQLEGEGTAAERAAQAELNRTPAQTTPQAAVVKAAQRAAQLIHPSEADTRKLIDQALRDTGWEANTERLRYSAGTRPEKGRFKAIAEWPTASGPADYVLFLGLMPVGVIEAKRQNKNASSHLSQAGRYSQHVLHLDGLELPGGPWGSTSFPFCSPPTGGRILNSTSS